MQFFNFGCVIFLKLSIVNESKLKQTTIAFNTFKINKVPF